MINCKHCKKKHKKRVQDQDKDRGDKGGGAGGGSEKRGKLIVDASCAPADIRYPTDLSLLNEAREKSEGIIDVLHEPLKGKEKKVRTYREKARRDYLRASKKRRLTARELQKAIGKQLRYVRRDLEHIEVLAERSSLEQLSGKEYRELLVIGEVYRQQERMYEEGKRRIEGRIVSISQSHVRPIVRGKAGSPVEFGAKISVSLVEGYAFIDRMSWENFNESKELIEQIEKYKGRFGNYPESVHADRIYRSRDNLRYCQGKGIRLSGPKLGRPKKDISREEKKMAREDELVRNAIEGKRRYSLNCIRAKLPETSGSVITMTFLVMNLEKLLKGVFLHFWRQWIISNLLGYQGHFAYNRVR